MPARAPHPCHKAGCCNLTTKRYCQAHEATQRPKAWKSTKGSSTSRGYGARWRRLRELILNRDPFCMVCQRAPATAVDHIRAKADGGDDDESNLRGICTACHKKKTSGDAAAARRKKREDFYPD